MSTTEKRIVRRLTRALDEEDLHLIDEMVAPGFVLRDPLTPEDMHGPEGLRQLFAGLYTAMTNAHQSIEHLIAEGGLVAIHSSLQGTFTSEWRGIVPTGERVAFRLINIWRIVGSKIVEAWFSYDTLAFMQQLGVVPPLEQDKG